MTRDQALFDVACEQRNVNANTAMEAIAELRLAQAEVAALRARIAELEAQLALL